MIIRKEVPENENLSKIFDIDGKSLDFNKQQEFNNVVKQNGYYIYYILTDYYLLFWIK